ncbi:MAG: cysteine desulfurase [Lachnospiraceae bacterium]|nr:cysteine desulfurase [Lachnospiraceae bacterium]
MITLIGGKMEVYLDNAATTALCKEAFETMQNTMFSDFGNPSSLHLKGVKASEYVKNAKQAIAKELKCLEKEIVFTSGGTESNNMALIGAAYANRRKGMHIISTSYEHASVYNPLIYLEQQGFEVTYISVDENGQIKPEELAETVREDTILVSMMYVNNEVGAVLDIAGLSAVVKAKNQDALFHCDAIQAFPKYKIVPKKCGIDLMSVSSHKFSGPKGCGFLYIRDKVKVNPIIHGGGQQNNMRSGTENVTGIAGMAAAMKVYADKRNEYVNHMYELKLRFVEGLKDVEGLVINAVYDELADELSLKDRVKMTAPHIISVSFPKARSEVFLHALEMKGIYCSSGSACSSNHPAISGTLKAIGVKDEYLDTTLRFSLSPETTVEEIDYAVAVIKEQLPIYMKFYRK